MISIILFSCIKPVVSQTLNWNGNSSSDWNTAQNWTPARVPTASDIVIINFSSNTATVTSASFCDSLCILSGRLNIVGTGKSLSVNRGMQISAGALLNMGSDVSATQSGSILEVGSVWNNLGGETGFRAGGGTVVFKDLDNLSTSGRRESFWNLNIDNPIAGLTTLNDSIYINNQITFTNGYLDAQAFPVVFTPSAENPVVLTGGGYIFGNAVVLTGGQPYSIDVPLGDLSGMLRRTVNLSYGTGRAEKFSVNYFNLDPNANGFNTNLTLPGLETICSVENSEYWKITSLTDNAARVNVHLYWAGMINANRIANAASIAYYQLPATGSEGWTSIGGFGVGDAEEGDIIADLPLTVSTTGTPLALAYTAPLPAPEFDDYESCQQTAGVPDTIMIFPRAGALDLNWYSSATGGSPFYTGQSLTLPVIADTIIYVSNYAGACESRRQPVKIRFYPVPDYIYTDTLHICDSNRVVQVQLPHLEGFDYLPQLDYRDQNNRPSTIHFASADTFRHKFVNDGVITLRVVRKGTNCTTTSPFPMVVKMHKKPSRPITADGLRCNPGVIQLNVYTNDTGRINFHWYSDSALTNLIPSITTATYIDTFSINKTFYVTGYVPKTTCESKASRIRAIITGYPDTVPALVRQDSVCFKGSVKFETHPILGSLLLYPDSTSDTEVATGGSSSIYTPEITTTTKFYLSYTTDIDCKSTARKPVYAVVTPLPGPIFLPDTGICSPRVVRLVPTIDTTGGIYIWFNDSAATDTIKIAGNTYSPQIVVDSKFYLRYRSKIGCESPVQRVNITVLPLAPAPQAHNDSVCVGGTARVSASGGDPDEEYFWFNNFNDDTPFASGAQLNIPGISSSRVVYVAKGNINCFSTKALATISVYPIPGPPVLISDTVCDGSSATIKVLNGTRGHYYNIYNSAIGDSLIAESVSGVYITKPLNRIDTFYVSALSGLDCEGPRKEIIVQVLPNVAKPTARDTIICGSRQITLQASGLPAGATYRWYNGDIGDSVIHESQTGTFTVNANANTSYFVSGLIEHACESGRIRLHVQVDSLPENPIVRDTTICSAAALTISVQNPGPGFIYEWYDQPVGGSALAISATPSYTLQVLANQRLYVLARSGEKCTSARVPVNLTLINLPPPPIVTTATRCGPGNAAVYVNAPANATRFLLWQTATSIEPIATSLTDTITGPQVSGNTQWFVSYQIGPCESQRVSVSISLSTLPPSPTAPDTVFFCKAGTITLSASSRLRNRRFIWTDNLGNELPNPSDSVINVAVGGSENFLVKVVNDIGCESQTAEVHAIFKTNVRPPSENTILVNLCNAIVGNARIPVNPGDNLWNWYLNYDSDSAFNYHGPALPVTPNGQPMLYYVSNVQQSCESQRTPVIVSPIYPPNGPVIDEITMPCIGGSAGNMRASFSNMSSDFSGNFYLHRNDLTPALSFTVAHMQYPVTSTDTVFFAYVNSAGCEGPRMPVYITAFTAPAAPRVPVDTLICAGARGRIEVRPGSTQIPAGYIWYQKTGIRLDSIGDTREPVYQFTPRDTIDTLYVSAYSIAGCPSPTSRIIVRTTVLEVPQANSIDACEGAGAFLEVLSPRPDYNYEWADRNGQLLGTGIRPSITLSAGRGFYYLTSVKGTCRSTPNIIEVNITAKPVIDSVRASYLCEPGQSIITVWGLNGTSYNLYSQPTGGTLVANSRSSIFPAPVVQGTTVFYISALNDGICPSTRIPVTVTVLGALTPDAGPPKASCNGESIRLSALAAEAPRIGKWSIVSGAGGSFSDIQDNNALFTGTPGAVYNLKWTYTAPGNCPALSATVAITIGSMVPKAGLTTQLVYCGNEPVTLFASGGSGNEYRWPAHPGITSDQIFFGRLAPGNYSDSVYIERLGCRGETVKVNYRVNPAVSIATVGPDLSICGGGGALNGSFPELGETGKWTSDPITGGTFINDADPKTTFFGTAGVSYKLTWTVSNPTSTCPPTSASHRFILQPTLPEPVLLLDTNACADQSLSVSTPVQSGVYYSWHLRRPDDSLIILDYTSASVNLDQWINRKITGVWKIEVAGIISTCQGLRSSRKFTVNPDPHADAGPDTVIFSDHIIKLPNAGTDTVIWTLSGASGKYNITQKSPFDSAEFVADEGVYELIETVKGKGGCVSEDRLIITVDNKIDLYNVFTPNADVANEVWNIGKVQLYPECMVTIYNRWNETIFESTGYKEAWDGTYKGVKLPSGGYLYKIVLKPGDAPIVGTITLIR